MKGEIVIIFGSESYILSVMAAQLCCHSMKEATDTKETNEHGCVIINFYLQKLLLSQICQLLYYLDIRMSHYIILPQAIFKYLYNVFLQ